MILLIDNYDSFTYNLVQLIGCVAPDREVLVRRNDALSPGDIDAWAPSHVILSPGPGTPDDAGVSVSVVRHVARRRPVLGVCLGHQCIAQAFGGRVTRAERLMHGKTSRIRHDGRGLFADVGDPFAAARYHSLTVHAASIEEKFEVTAWTEDRCEVMGIRHRHWPVEGVQFHPESFMTEEGPVLMRNFLNM